MNTTLLIFFAIPLAVIIISIALQKILKCPLLVAGIVFSVGIIVTASIGNLNILSITLAYTLISYITTLLTCFISRFNNNNNCRNNNHNDLLTISSHCQSNGNGDLLKINSNSSSGNENNLLTISSSNNDCSNTNNNINCNCNSDNNFNQVNTINGVIRVIDNNGNNNFAQDEFNTRINIVPNASNNGRTGSICGRYRRR